MTVRLRNGDTVLLREIRPEDKPLLERLGRLSSPETVYRRFLSPKPRLSAVELRYLAEVDFADHYALVAVRASDPTALVAVGRWVRDTIDPTAAEMAIIVADPWQNERLGTAIGRELAAAARARGVRRFTATMLADNVPAQRLLARISAELATVRFGAVNELSARLAA